MSELSLTAIHFINVLALIAFSSVVMAPLLKQTDLKWGQIGRRLVIILVFHLFQGALVQYVLYTAK